mgnify:CR=1 FL=1
MISEDSQNSLYERAKVPFERSLEEKEIEELFTYLARNLSLDIRYTIEKSRDVNGGDLYPISHVYPRVRGIKVSGSITPGKKYRDKRCILANFNCFRDFGNREYHKVDGLEFFVAPGCDEITDAAPGELELMDDTRARVNEFIEILKDRESTKPH